jgi:hypothetical protein
MGTSNISIQGSIQTGLPISKLQPLSGPLDGNDYFVISKANAKNKYESLRCDISSITEVISSDIYNYTVHNLPQVSVITTELSTRVEELSTMISSLLSVIPPQAYDGGNELADKNYVNSSIQTSTAEFRGTYDLSDELSAVSADSNDYAYVTQKTLSGNIYAYDRYKYSDVLSCWLYEYTINNSYFTSDQWSAINSGVTEDLVKWWDKSKIYLTTNDLDGTTIIYDTKDKKVKIGQTAQNDIDNRVKKSDLKCEEWTFWMKDETSSTYAIVLSCKG